MCFPFDNKKPTTADGIEAVQRLQIIAFCEMSLIFTRCILDFHFGYLYELLVILILWQSWTTLSSCLCQLYILIALYLAFFIFVQFATKVQHQLPILGTTPAERVINFVQIITFVFYLISQYYAFLIQRILKAIELEGSFVKESEYEKGLPQQRQAAQQSYGVFQGRGVAIG
ncbi:hypothetical protein pb186bvf_013277 [Paramecium bursaria]